VIFTRSLVYFWPDGCFKNLNLKKDPGQIPLYLSKKGFKTTIMVPCMNSTNIPENIEVYELLKSTFLKWFFQHREFKFRAEVLEAINFLSIPKVLSYLIKTEPDLLIVDHYNGPITLFTLLLYRQHLKEDKTKRIVLKYDLSPDIFNTGIIARLLNRLILYMFDIVIVESKCGYDLLGNIKQSPKIKVVPNGYLPHEVVTYSSDREKVILSVGRVTKQKGHDILIQAFAKAHSLRPDWFLKIAGPIEDKQYYAKLREMVKNLGLTEYVSFLGSISESELEREYKSASIFCLLSRYESFGIVRAEAMSYGLPAIISSAGCGMEYEKYGTIVVPIEDIDKSTEAMLRLMEDSALRRKISREQLSGILSWDEVGEEIYKIAFST